MSAPTLESADLMLTSAETTLRAAAVTARRLGHREGGGSGRRDGRQQRDRARLGDRVLAAAQRLRVAGRARQLLPDPRGRRVCDAAGDRARGRARPSRGRGGTGRDDPELDEVAAGVHGGDDGDLDPVPPSDRRGRRGQAAVGSGARDPGRLPLPDAVHPARLPPGARRLSVGRHQPGRRAGRPARDRRRARRGRARGHGRVHRNPAVVRRDDVLLRGAAPPPARRGGARASPGDPAVGPRVEGVGGDRRARDHRGAPEHRHHRRQAPLLVRSGELLQRHRGGRQGPDLGRDGSGLLPGARGLAQAFGRRGRPSCAGQGARDRRRRRRPVPADLRLRVHAR